ncbi:MAG: hypothetical protein HQ582_31120 [Planctomycetes bacterium]|nr:hypothetical protein [Planctomycetota bacterium]
MIETFASIYVACLGLTDRFLRACDNIYSLETLPCPGGSSYGGSPTWPEEPDSPRCPSPKEVRASTMAGRVEIE